MSAQSEARQIMSHCLGMSSDGIGDEFTRWNAYGELVSNRPLALSLSPDFVMQRLSADSARCLKGSEGKQQC